MYLNCLCATAQAFGANPEDGKGSYKNRTFFNLERYWDDAKILNNPHKGCEIHYCSNSLRNHGSRLNHNDLLGLLIWMFFYAKVCFVVGGIGQTTLKIVYVFILNSFFDYSDCWIMPGRNNNLAQKEGVFFQLNDSWFMCRNICDLFRYISKAGNVNLMNILIRYEKIALHVGNNSSCVITNLIADHRKRNRQLCLCINNLTLRLCMQCKRNY